MTEWWGIWSDIGKGWLYNINSVTVFYFPDKAVALAQLSIVERVAKFDKYTDMRVRSFAEWIRELEISVAVDKWDKNEGSIK